MSLLEVKNLTKKFDGVTAVQEITFTIDKGEVIGLIGPNGSGKSTLFNCITGFLKPTEGSIVFDGIEITSRQPSFICGEGISCTFQKAIPLAKMSVRECILIGAYARYTRKTEAHQKSDETISFVGLQEKQHFLVTSLNMFERKRVEIGMALSTDPSLLLLDEIVAGLNPTEVEEILEMIGRIRQKGITLFIVEHVMQVIMKISQRVIVIAHGQKIASGPPIEVVRNSEVINAYLGERYRAS